MVVADGWVVAADWLACSVWDRCAWGPKWNDWQGKDGSGWLEFAAPIPDITFIDSAPGNPWGLGWACPVGAGGTPGLDTGVDGWVCDWPEGEAVPNTPCPCTWGWFWVPAWVVRGTCPCAAAAAATDAGTFEINAMKSSTMIRVRTLGCPVWVDWVELLPFVFVPTEDRCSPNELEKVSLAAPLSALALIRDPLVDVVEEDGCVLAGAVEPTRETFDMIVVKEIPPWGLTWICKFWLVPCGRDPAAGVACDAVTGGF